MDYQCHIDPNYLSNQKEITQRMRIILIDWFFEIDDGKPFSFDDRTLFLTIILLDKYLSLEQVNVKDLQAVGIICLHLAAKYQDDDFTIEDATDLCDKKYPETYLYELELEILKKFNWNILYESTVHYLFPKKSINPENYYFTLFLYAHLIREPTYLRFSNVDLAKELNRFIDLMEKTKNEIEFMINMDDTLRFIYLSWIKYNNQIINNYFKRYLVQKTPPEIKVRYDLESTCLLLSIKKLEISKSDLVPLQIITSFTIIDKLGNGAFGIVHWIKMNELDFALKRETEPDKELDKNTLREINSLIHLNHPNIIKIIGIYLKNGKEIQIVMEKADINLSEGILTDRLEMVMRQKLIMQLLSAVKYMHQMKIMHRDLSPRNILLSNQKTVLKITDFGSSKYFSTYVDDKYTSDVCMRYYQPIEMLLEKKNYNEKVDVWSTGCLIWFILHEKNLFYTFSGNQSDTISKIFEVMGTPDNEDRYKKYPRRTIDQLSSEYQEEGKIIQQMLNYNPDLRITSEEANNLYHQKIDLN